MRISDWSSDVCSSDLETKQLPISALANAPSQPRGAKPDKNERRGQHEKAEAQQPVGDLSACITTLEQGIALDAPPEGAGQDEHSRGCPKLPEAAGRPGGARHATSRSVEHTSELQSLMRNSYA